MYRYNRDQLIYVEYIPLIFLYHLRPPLIDFVPDQTSRHYLWFLKSYWDRFDISFTTSARAEDHGSRSLESHIRERFVINHNLADNGSLEHFQNFRKHFITYGFFFLVLTIWWMYCAFSLHNNVCINAWKRNVAYLAIAIITFLGKF